MQARKGSRIIVADDLRDSADTVAELLAAQGMEARAVYDGRQAIALAESWKPDGAVLDLGLPGLTGYEVARELRNRFGKEIRLVAYTGWAADRVRDEAMEAGFDGFLVKPAHPAELLLALGKPVSDLIRRSIDARAEQFRRQIELGHTLLEHGITHPDALEVICGFLERAFHACRTSLPDLPVSPEEREKLEIELERILGRIAQARQRH
jgi:CheY-like chemotaxis protein